MKNIALLFILLLLSGCAMGRTTSYQGTSNFKINYTMPPVSLAVIDKRPYVLDGTKKPSYSGTQRSIGGVPYNVNTASGKPLAEDLQEMVGNTLMKYGIIVDKKALLPIDITEQEAVKKITSKEKKAILLFINEWRTHIYINPIFEYDLKILAIGTDGNILSSAINKGTKEFGKDREVKNFADVVSIIFDDLFNDEKIKYAFISDKAEFPLKIDTIKEEDNKGKEAPANITKEEPKCTTDQILKMKEMGMTDSQIKAACD